MTIRVLMSMLLLLLAAPALAADAWIASQPKLQTLSPAAADGLLAQVARRYPSFQDRVKAIALLRVGTPYVLGCLGEEKGQDRKPIFRIDEADCTVLVLTTSAMAHGGSLAAAREWMKKLNYYPAKDPVAYANRVHFTEDRLLSSPYFRDVTARVSSGLKSMTLVLNRKADGSKLLDIPFEKKVTVRWIPIDAVNATMLDRLPPTAGVAFVREANVKLGLVVAHEGLVLDRRDLVHADSVAKRVSRTPLLDYLKRNADWFQGVILYELR